jgi:hypothetical protein
MTDEAGSLMNEASVRYTAGSQRQAIYLASWLLGAHRTEDELCERLRRVLDEIYPPRREDMLKKALSKLQTKSAKKFIASCRSEERKRCRAKK